MALVLSYTTTPPTMDTQIYMDVFRENTTIRVVVSAVCTFRYSDGYLNPSYYATLNVWTATDRQSVPILEYGESWRASDEMSRTRTVSVTLTSTSDKVEVGFNISGAEGQHSLVTPDAENYTTLDAPAYVAPTAPTWFRINPNPCDINQAPLLTWGGATAGSNGVLTYDLEIQSLKPDGSWSSWSRLLNASQSTSYQEVAIKDITVYSQKPFLGVQYQYRVRSSDNYATTSNWIYGTLNVTFGNPTPPTSYTVNPQKVKPKGTIQLSWSGASGGGGNISQYQLQQRSYDHTTQTWGSWTDIGNTTISNFNYAVPEQLTSGDLIQFRIRVLNSWGQLSSWLTTSSVTVSGNRMWFKINNIWKETEVYLKINNLWKEVVPYIKVSGTWKEST